MNQIFIGLIIFLALANITLAQTFEPAVPVDTTTSGVFFQWQPNIAVDKEGNVGVVWVNQIPGNYVVMFAKSNDGGQTWQKTIVEDSPLAGPDDARYNPALAFDTQNDPWVVWQYFQSWSTAITFVARSQDGGKSFGDPFFGQASWDTETRSIAIDENNNVYLPWRYNYGRLKCVTFFAGDPENWSSAHISPTNLTVRWYPVICTSGKDTVYAACRADSLDNDKPSLIYFSRSIDAGQHFSDPLLVSLGPLQGTHGAVYPAISAAPENTIYVAWPDPQTGDYDIYLSKSLNGGVSFLPERRINDIIEGTQSNVYMTYRSGLGLCVAYLDGWYSKQSVDDSPLVLLQRAPSDADIYFTRSTDGGNTFSESVLVTDSTFQQYLQWIRGIAVDDSGNVYVVFDDLRYGKSLVFVSKANFDSTPVDSEPSNVELPGDFFLQQNYPNPFNAQTTIEYAVPFESFVTLNIYNILGEKVRTLIKNSASQGLYQAMWDGRNDQGNLVSSGVYLYKLETPQSSIVKKLVFFR